MELNTFKCISKYDPDLTVSMSNNHAWGMNFCKYYKRAKIVNCTCLLLRSNRGDYRIQAVEGQTSIISQLQGDVALLKEEINGVNSVD